MGGIYETVADLLKLDSKPRVVAIECGGVFHLSDGKGKCAYEVQTLDGIEASTDWASNTAQVEGILAEYPEYNTMTFYYGSRNGKPAGCDDVAYPRSVCTLSGHLVQLAV